MMMMSGGKGKDCISNPPIECVVFGWGANEDGQLGFDNETYVPTPRVVEILLGSKLRGRSNLTSPLVCGSRNSLALSKEGNMWTWGWNERGTLGRGERGIDKKPRKIAALGEKKIIQASIGGWHCLAIDEEGAVYAWGGNEYLQCGVEFPKRDIVFPIRTFTQKIVKQVSCGGMHSLALTEEGEVWTWGEPWGEFSLNQKKTPRKVEGAANIAQIACGAFHNMALTTCSSHVLCWGINDYGQLGIGSTTYKTIPTKVVDLEDHQIVSIAAGGWHSLAISLSGEIYTWGRGEYGRLGLHDKSGSSRLRPNKVPGLQDHKIIQACAGGTHTLCLTEEGQMLVWGRGSFGRLGTGSLRNSTKPVELFLPGGSMQWRVIAIACGGRHSLCLALPVHLEEPSSSLAIKVTDGNEGDDEYGEFEKVGAKDEIFEEDAENETEDETWEKKINREDRILNSDESN